MHRQFSLQELLLLPVVLLSVVPCVQTAHLIGLRLAPDAFWDGTAQRLAINIGLPMSLTKQIAYGWGQIPGILLLLIYCVILYLTNHRIADATACMLIVATPLVDTLPWGLAYLRYQLLTVLLCTICVFLYLAAVRKRPSDKSHRFMLYGCIHALKTAGKMN